MGSNIEIRRKVLIEMIAAWQPAGVVQASNSAGVSGAIDPMAPWGASTKILLCIFRAVILLLAAQTRATIILRYFALFSVRL